MQICDKLTACGEAFTDLYGEVTTFAESKLLCSDSANVILNSYDNYICAL